MLSFVLFVVQRETLLFGFSVTELLRNEARSPAPDVTRTLQVEPETVSAGVPDGGAVYREPTSAVCVVNPLRNNLARAPAGLDQVNVPPRSLTPTMFVNVTHPDSRPCFEYRGIYSGHMPSLETMADCEIFVPSPSVPENLILPVAATLMVP